MENKINKKAVKVKEVAQEVNTVNKNTITTEQENTVATEQENTVATEQENTPTNSKGRTIKNIPNHITELALIVKNNAQIRRYTAIAIINYLCQKREISKISAEEQAKGKGNYVNFLWDKFTVKSNGLSRDYRYTEKFFITALIGSFTSFAANSKEVIINFLKEENADFNIE
jgi:hypothetical protein